MIKKVLFPILGVFLMVSLFSCKKEGRGHRAEMKSETLNITLKAGTLYQLDLSKYGDADDIATISAQGTNYQTSQIDHDGATGKYIYYYVSNPLVKTGNPMSDKVILKVAEPEGRCRHIEETDITINFTLN